MESNNKQEIVSGVKRHKISKYFHSGIKSSERKSVHGSKTGSINNGRNDNSPEDRKNFIESLPIETLSEVFTYLRRSDIISAASVCKNWRSIIFNSPELWRKSQLTLRCCRKSKRLDKAKSFCRIFGRYLRHIKIRCSHSCSHNQCRYMAYNLRKLLQNIPAKLLRTFQVSHLQISQGKMTPVKRISDTLSHLLLSQNKLTSFHMSKSFWPSELGISVFASLSRKFSKTLTSLRLDDYFCTSFSPPNSDPERLFTNSLTSLDSLTHLTINYQYLTDYCVRELALKNRRTHNRFNHYHHRHHHHHHRRRHHSLTRLELIASDVSPLTDFISTEAWKRLTEACPGLKIDFKIRGHVLSPSVSIPAILDPIMRIQRIDLDIGPSFTLQDGARLNIGSVLRYITINFRKRLVKFSLNIDNNLESMDKAIVKLVRKCKYLVNVKVMGHFSDYDVTRQTIKEIIRSRKKKSSDVRTGSETDSGRRAVSTVSGHGVVFENNGGGSSSVDDASGSGSSGGEFSGMAGASSLRGGCGSDVNNNFNREYSDEEEEDDDEEGDDGGVVSAPGGSGVGGCSNGSDDEDDDRFVTGYTDEEEDDDFDDGDGGGGC